MCCCLSDIHSLCMDFGNTLLNFWDCLFAYDLIAVPPLATIHHCPPPTLRLTTNSTFQSRHHSLSIPHEAGLLPPSLYENYDSGSKTRPTGAWWHGLQGNTARMKWLQTTAFNSGRELLLLFFFLNETSCILLESFVLLFLLLQS